MNSITKKSNLQYGLEGVADFVASVIELIPAVTGAVLTTISGVMNIVSGPASVVTGAIGGAVSWVSSGIKGLFKGKGFSGFNKESYDSGAETGASFMDGLNDLVEVGGKAIQQSIENYSQ